MTHTLLEAIREQPGERTLAELAEDLAMPLAEVRHKVDLLRQSGKVAASVYRLVPDNRDPLHVVGIIPVEGGTLRWCNREDLEVRIVAALQVQPHAPGPLAELCGVGAHSGCFHRACRWLVRHGIILDWRAPYPANQ